MRGPLSNMIIRDKKSSFCSSVSLLNSSAIAVISFDLLLARAVLVS